MNGGNPRTEAIAIGLAISANLRFDDLSLSNESIKNDLDILH